MILKNTTSLNTHRIVEMFRACAGPHPTDGLDIRVRYSRSADFSGTCYYDRHRLHVNLGRHLSYPYLMDTYIARAVTARSCWWKPLYAIELTDGYQVVLFVLLHEYYHWLVKRAGRNTRQKESMCDRFAARALVDRFGAKVRDPRGAEVPRRLWDFQDLNGFVAPARLARRVAPPEQAAARNPAARPPHVDQLMLFQT